jgi:transposase
VKESLCAKQHPGDTVIMDKLRAHKNGQTIARIEQTGERVAFLPAYSPDLNPIELMWSKVKRQLRACTRESLLEAIGKVLAQVTTCNMFIFNIIKIVKF